HRIINETAFDARRPLCCLVTVKFIDERYCRHVKFRALGVRQCSQRLIKSSRSQKKGSVQHCTVDLALENACTIKIKKRFNEHFAGAVETFLKWCIFVRT